LAGKRRYENKTLVKFQLIVTLDKVIYITNNILIVVTLPQFSKKIGLPSAEKMIIKIGRIGRLGLDVCEENAFMHVDDHIGPKFVVLAPADTARLTPLINTKTIVFSS
jgi:hypothetical protein